MSLPYDPDVALDALRADPPLARLIEQVGPFRLELRSMISPFQALMRSIIYQQLSGKAAATTLVLVTHDERLASRCQRTVVLDTGRIVQ